MITGKTLVAGVVGRPIVHSLSPILHNAWLAEAGIDGVYVPFAADAFGFERLANGFRGSGVRGLNVTLPFKEAALAVADKVSDRARAAGAANLITFEANGMIHADNTDGVGLIGAFASQAPHFDVRDGGMVVVGGGGAARGAVAALLAAGAWRIWIVNRTLEKAEAIASALGEKVLPLPLNHAASALRDAGAVINATSAGLSGEGRLDLDLGLTPPAAVIMDMVYKPLETAFLKQARDLGRPTVDGLAMLIAQAVPSFEAFYGALPPATVDVRRLALKALES